MGPGFRRTTIRRYRAQLHQHRHCERSEAVQTVTAAGLWIASLPRNDDGRSWGYPAAPASFAGATSVVAISRFSSGRHEPQLVPALSFAPISAAVRAPAAMVSQMVPRPTPKQAQTIGPVET